jgi:hypothetical protein
VREADVLEGEQTPILERLDRRTDIRRPHPATPQPLGPVSDAAASLRAGTVVVSGEPVENAAELHGAFS